MRQSLSLPSSKLSLCGTTRQPWAHHWICKSAQEPSKEIEAKERDVSGQKEHLLDLCISGTMRNPSMFP